MLTKQNFLFLLSLFYTTLFFAQIGINTNTPLTLLHVDGAADNGTTSASKYKNDVVVTAEGNVGVGLTAPQTKLHIVSEGTTSPFRLQDGNQGKDKVLLSDADGNGSWSSGVYNNFGIVPYAISDFTGVTQQLYYTGLNFTFPEKGVYSVSVGVKVEVFISNFPNVTWAQLLPKVSSVQSEMYTIWRAESPRFQGGYEINATPYIANGTTSTTTRFVFNQTLTITEDLLTMYLVLQINGWTAPQRIVVSWGNNTSVTSNADVGGSYIKIN